MEDRMLYVMVGLLIFLELILIIMIIAKLRREKQYFSKSMKMRAEVLSVTKKRLMSKYTKYTFFMKAVNGNVYIVSSSGLKASRLRVGDTVDIRIPEGAPFHFQADEYYEKICIQGNKALDTLSYTEKVRLNNYLDEKQKAYISSTVELDEHNLPYLASDGGGLRQEIIPMCIIAAVIAAIIVIFFVLNTDTSDLMSKILSYIK